jgi:DNA polymerase-3 subunit beta
MEFSIDRSEFLHGLSLAQGVVERRNTLPILANVLLEADATLFVSATDLEVHVKRRCAAKVQSKGAATVGARKLYEFVRELKPGEVVVRLLENQFVEIVSGRSRVRLVGLPAGDFPTFPQSGETGSMTLSLPGKELARMIDRTLFAVSLDDTRTNLSGVHLSATKGALRLVGTDGHRLALVDHVVKGLEPISPGVILPRKGLGELRKLLDEAEGEARLNLVGSVVRVEHGGVELLMRLIDGEFPNYEQVIPKSSKHTLLIDKEELFSALRRVSVVASDRARGVKFNISPGQLTVVASSPDFGEASEEIEVAYQGAEFSVGFNARYLTDVLGVLPDGGKVEVGLSDDVSPGVLRSEDDESYSYVVMPMRL